MATLGKFRFSNTAEPIVIRSQLAVSTSISELRDVVETDKSDGNTLVYNSANSTYILESPNNLNLTLIDCGTF